MRRHFSTKKSRVLLAIVALVLLAIPASLGWFLRKRVFHGDGALDKKTYVAPSTIPGAGQGLFAARKIKKGEVIAEMGGRLVFHESFAKEDRGYLFAVPSCATWDVWPYNALDGRKYGGRASKINFAPRTINGLPTGLQNARGYAICHRPYVHFKALREISKGEEIFTSYGAIYNYDFMEIPAVRGHFCDLLKRDCSTKFEWEP